MGDARANASGPGDPRSGRSQAPVGIVYGEGEERSTRGYIGTGDRHPVVGPDGLSLAP